MNERIKELKVEAWDYACSKIPPNALGQKNHEDYFAEKFAELLLTNLAEELITVATASKQANPEWANGVDHAAMLAQRMTMDLPQWPEAE